MAVVSSMITDDVSAVAAALGAGAVVGLPTDTVYGLGVSVAHGRVSDLFACKGRPDGQPVAVLVATRADAEQLGVLGPAADRIVSAFWPGPLTIVVPRVDGWDVDLGGAPGTVGLRCPDDPALGALLGEVGPLAVTSANRSGRPPLGDPADIAATFGADVPVVWDDGPRHGTPSTVVDCTVTPAVVLREGGVDRDMLTSSGVELA